MSRKARHRVLLDKSLASAISAIEIYNKPDFKYRVETFSILIINAWELLLKSKILKDSRNDLRAIQIQGKPANKNGESSKRFYPKLNRSGNPMTIEIKRAIEKANISNALKDNLFILIEVRDNAIHFLNEDPLISKRVSEIGMANLKSYIKLFHDWFDYDLSQYNFYLMPMSFFHPHELESFSVNRRSQQIEKLLNYIQQKEKQYPSDEENDHNVLLRMKTRFSRSAASDGLEFKHSPEATLSVRYDAEEKFKNKYPLSYQDLLNKLKNRYVVFSTNKDFYTLKKRLEQNTDYCGVRHLNIDKKTGPSKKYYSYNILKEFDKHYSK